MNSDNKRYDQFQLQLHNFQAKIQFISEALNHLNDPLTSLTGAVDILKNSHLTNHGLEKEQIEILDRAIETLHIVIRRGQLLIKESNSQRKDVIETLENVNIDWPKEKTILVIDDDADVRTIMINYLNKMGYAVMLASDGQQGINLAKAHYYDLIISDINMPKMDGIEFVSQVKSINPWVPILVITGYHTPEVTELTKTFDSVGLLNKPFKYEKLEDTIHKIFN